MCRSKRPEAAKSCRELTLETYHARERQVKKTKTSMTCGVMPWRFGGQLRVRRANRVGERECIRRQHLDVLRLEARGWMNADFQQSEVRRRGAGAEISGHHRARGLLKGTDVVVGLKRGHGVPCLRRVHDVRLGRVARIEILIRD